MIAKNDRQNDRQNDQEQMNRGSFPQRSWAFAVGGFGNCLRQLS